MNGERGTGDHGTGRPQERETTVSEQGTGHGRPQERETTGTGDHGDQETENIKNKKTQERNSNWNFFPAAETTRNVLGHRGSVLGVPCGRPRAAGNANFKTKHTGDHNHGRPQETTGGRKRRI